MPGPLPDPKRKRRNAPTIPTTNLPVSGRQGDAPEPPAWVELGPAGLGWWESVWSTPQAVGWGDSVGMEPMVARRASLEDDLTALAEVDGLDFGEALDAETDAQLRRVIGRVASLATGRLAIFKEMRELDDRLGLTPRGLAALRWVIVADPKTETAAPVPDQVAARREGRRTRLTG